MYTVKVTSQFNSAHNLREYKGKCESLHGHNWRVEVAVSSGSLDRTGMVVDFKRLREALDGILAGLDHKYLNELEYFAGVNPTSENIAKYVFDRLKDGFPDLDLESVTVYETDTSSAAYSE